MTPPIGPDNLRRNRNDDGDDLRTRIAAVWLQHDGPYSQYKPDTDLMRLACDCGWVGETDEYTEYANHFADAVIAELGLKHYCRNCGGWGPFDE